MSSKLHPSYPSIKKGGLVTSIFGFALSSFAALGVAFLVSEANPVTMVRATDSESSITAPDFSQETEADPSSLTFTLTASSLTDSTNSFRLTARSGSVSTVRSSSRTGFDVIYITVEDENWTNWSTATTNGQAAYNAAEEAGEEYVPMSYNAYVYNIDTSNSQDDIYIPEEVRGATVGSSNAFILNIVGIHANACAQYSTGGEEQGIVYGDTVSINIPETITTVDEGAFPDADNITFNLEASSIPEGWSDDWASGSFITNYGTEYSPSPSGRAHPVGSEGTKAFGVSHDYCIGSYLQLEGYDEYYQPMYITYDVVDAEGDVVRKDQVKQQPVTNSVLQVDAVGGGVGGQSLTMNLDFDVDKGCHVDPESIRFHNIYDGATSQIGGRSYTHPVIGEGHGPYYVLPTISFSQTVNISDIFTFESGNSNSFGEHISFSIKMNVNRLQAYQTFCASQYASNRSRIENGSLSIRVLLDSVGLSRYRFVYDDATGQEVSTPITVSTPIDYATISDNMTFTFLVQESLVGEGFSFASLKGLYLENFNIKMDLYDADDNAVETGSALTTRFGSMSLLPDGKEAVGTTNLVTVMIWIYVIFIIVAAATATIIYFVRKEKYKNDEFRRVNGKKYFQETLKKVLGSFLILSSLMFIIFRWGFLNNSIAVYNPLDIWVIIFTVAGAIALGLFIRDAVVGVKLSNERKRKERLHIDDDVVDDGTN